MIYSTGGAWSAHLAAYWLKRKTKVSWIAEIHDPLVQRENKLNFELKTSSKSDEKNIGSKKFALMQTLFGGLLMVPYTLQKSVIRI